MKIKANRADSFAEKPDRGIAAVLVYGPDAGLIRERCDKLIRAVVDDPDDPFRVVSLSPDTLSKEPALLADEAATMPFGGGTRVVRVRDGDEAIVPACSAFLDHVSGDSFVVVSAGDLTPKSKLRQLFERAQAAAALPCYRDEGRTLDRLITDTLRAYGLEPSREAHAYLVNHLGSDRAVTRRELEKLALYVGRGRVEARDAQACVGDNAALSVDDLAFACLGGDSAGVERAFQNAVAEGATPIQLVRATGRHAQRLYTVAVQADTDAAMDALKPPVFWKHKPRFKSQAASWGASDLGRVLSILLDAETRMKTTGFPQESIASRALLTVARTAPKT